MEADFFLSFRHFIESENQSFKTLIAQEDISFFFEKEGIIYGGTEDSRVCFARMKNPDKEDDDETWAEQANFYGIDIKRAIAGDKVDTVFNYKDLDKIKVIPEEKAEKMLCKK